LVSNIVENSVVDERLDGWNFDRSNPTKDFKEKYSKL
jgi:hypothetical protein